MDNYNEAIEQMLDDGKTPESIYEDVLAIVKERNNKKVREARESAIKALDEALVTFFESMGDMSDDEVKDMSSFYLNSIVDTADASRKRKNKSNSETSSPEKKSEAKAPEAKTPSADPWLMRLFGLED